MTMEAAQQQLDTSEPDIAKKDKIIRERMAEIATLKAQLATAERSLTSATNAKKKIQEKNKEALTMVQSDASLIMAKVKKAMNGYGGSGAPETVGRESMEDMITLGNDEDIIKLATEWGSGLPRSLCAVLGAIQSIQAACKKHQVQVSPPVLVSAITTLVQRVFDTVVKDSFSTHTTDKLGVKSWPLIASAMNLTENLGQEYYDMLSNAVKELVKNMKEKNNSKLSWKDENKDCIVDLLLPVHDAIESENGSSIKAALMQEIKAGLISSVSEIETVKNYAMPAEAEIARKQRFPQVANFLASSTETTLNLNLSKAGRMAVHRLIDNQMGYGKVRHSSVGSGHGRYLVLTKECADTPSTLKAKKEQKEKHMELLARLQLVQLLSVTLPPYGTKLDLIFKTNRNMGNMTEVVEVIEGSPLMNQIPNSVCIVTLKSDIIGCAQPRSMQETIAFFSKVQAAASRQLEMVVVPTGTTHPKTKIAPTAVSNSTPSETVQSYEAMYNEAVEKHKMDTLKLLKESAARGEKSVSVAAMGEARKVNIAAMSRANASNTSHRNDVELHAALTRAEGDAVHLYIADAQEKKRKEAAATK